MTEFKMEYDAALTSEWEDEDLNDGEWPYPTRYVRRELSGPLADAIRKRVGADAAALVHITEAEISGGYSEYTQENDYQMTVECAGHEKRFESYWASHNFDALLAWLDGAE